MNFKSSQPGWDEEDASAWARDELARRARKSKSVQGSDSLLEMFEEHSKMLDELLGQDARLHRPVSNGRDGLRRTTRAGDEGLRGWVAMLKRRPDLSWVFPSLVAAAVCLCMVMIGFDAVRVFAAKPGVTIQRQAAEAPSEVRTKEARVEVRPVPAPLPVESFVLPVPSTDGSLRVPVLNVAMDAGIIELQAQMAGEGEGASNWRVELMHDEDVKPLTDAAPVQQNGSDAVLAVRVPVAGLADGLYSIRLTPLGADTGRVDSRPFILKRGQQRASSAQVF